MAHHSDWADTAAFLKGYASSMLGLPNKHIHVDTDKQPNAVQQTAGQLYSKSVEDYASMAPALYCPNCGRVVQSLSDAKSLYTLTVTETGGKTHQGDIPPCPIKDVDMEWAKFLYKTSPCNCRVDVNWAGAFSAELSHRMNGNKPQPLKTLTVKEREAKVTWLQDILTQLYKGQNDCNNKPESSIRKAIDYWIVVVVDQIQRLCPGKHNCAPAPNPLHNEVATWASERSLPNPGVAVSKAVNAKGQAIGFWGTGMVVNNPYPLEMATVGNPLMPPPNSPMYEGNNGTVQPVPLYEGQQPIGILMSSTADKATIMPMPVQYEAPLMGPTSVGNLGGGAGTGGFGDDEKQAAAQAAIKLKMVQQGILSVQKAFNAEALTKQTFSTEALLNGLKSGFKAELAKLQPKASPIAFFGANAEEKEAYLQGAKPIDHATAMELLGSSVTKPWLQMVANCFDTEKAFVTSLVQQEILQGNGDTITLLETCAAIQRNIEDYIKKNTNLETTTIRFLQVFKAIVVQVPNKPLPTVPLPLGTSGPLPGAAPDPTQDVRSKKKRRTIRHIDEE